MLENSKHMIPDTDLESNHLGFLGRSNNFSNSSYSTHFSLATLVVLLVINYEGLIAQ